LFCTVLFKGGLATKKRAVDFYKKGINELETGLQISCDEEGTCVLFNAAKKNFAEDRVESINMQWKFTLLHKVTRVSDMTYSFLTYTKQSHGGLMVSVLDFTLSDPGSVPGWGYSFVFLGKTFYSCCASLHPHV